MSSADSVVVNGNGEALALQDVGDGKGQSGRGNGKGVGDTTSVDLTVERRSPEEPQTAATAAKAQAKSAVQPPATARRRSSALPPITKASDLAPAHPRSATRKLRSEAAKGSVESVGSAGLTDSGVDVPVLSDDEEPVENLMRDAQKSTRIPGEDASRGAGASEAASESSLLRPDHSGGHEAGPVEQREDMKHKK